VVETYAYARTVPHSAIDRAITAAAAAADGS
jgi:hypothetical protein